MSHTIVPCDHCSKPVSKETKRYNFAKRRKRKLYCDQTCSRAARFINDPTLDKAAKVRNNSRRWYNKQKEKVITKQNQHRLMLTRALVSGEKTTLLPIGI